MLVHLDGFDSYSVVADLAMEYGNISNVSFSTSTGRFGGGMAHVGASGMGGLTKALGATTTEFWVGFAAKFGVLSTTYPSGIIEFQSGAGIEFAVCITNGLFTLHLGRSGDTIVQNSVSVPQGMVLGGWQFLEIRYKYGASAGVVEVWVNGVQCVTYSGNTAHMSGGSILQLVIPGTRNSGMSEIYLDDLYIIDVAAGGANTTRLGDCRIATLLPTGNSTNQATPSAGSAYTCVNEAQWNTSNYVTFTPYAAGMIEDYTLGSLPSTPTAVFGVRVLAIADKSDAGSAGLCPYVNSGGTTALGTGQPLSTSWGHIAGVFEVDPHTSAAWTTAAVNAMICGVETV